MGQKQSKRKTLKGRSRSYEQQSTKTDTPGSAAMESSCSVLFDGSRSEDIQRTSLQSCTPESPHLEATGGTRLPTVDPHEDKDESLSFHAWMIRKNLSRLVENIDSKNTLLWDKLVEKGVLSRRELREIKVC